eukprot:4906366-Lingulodinium_polyedra.AAC.1
MPDRDRLLRCVGDSGPARRYVANAVAQLVVPLERDAADAALWRGPTEMSNALRVAQLSAATS